MPTTSKDAINRLSALAVANALVYHIRIIGE